MAEFENPLIRGLTLTDTSSLVIGTIIGTGVFLKTTVMAQQVDTPSLVLAHGSLRVPSRWLER